MKTLGSIALLICACSPALLAQTAPAAAAAPVPAAAPAIAPAPAPDPAKLAMAREVVKALQVDRAVDNTEKQVAQMAVQMSKAETATTPEEKARSERIQARIKDVTTAAIKDMREKLEIVFAEVYTDAELKAISTFFASPEGVSFMAKQQQLGMRLRPILQPRELMAKMQAIVTEETPPPPAPPSEPKAEAQPQPAAPAPAPKP